MQGSRGWWQSEERLEGRIQNPRDVDARTSSRAMWGTGLFTWRVRTGSRSLSRSWIVVACASFVLCSSGGAWPSSQSVALVPDVMSWVAHLEQGSVNNSCERGPISLHAPVRMTLRTPTTTSPARWRTGVGWFPAPNQPFSERRVQYPGMPSSREKIRSE